jgi:hypothetical protein
MENYLTSESITNLAKALMVFHKEVGKVVKAETNPFFKSKYAALPQILEAINEPLQKSGLSFVQFPTGKNNLTTQLMHISGEWMRGDYFMQPAKEDPQGYGSCITYQRRYALGAILGLNIDEDDDGNTASGKTAKVETTLEKAPVCSKCGLVGIKARRPNGSTFWTCPEWQAHKQEKEKFEMVQVKTPLPKEQADFLTNLPN